MKRVYLAGCFQETNSFAPRPTDLALFARGKLLEGSALLDDVRGANLELAGMLAALPEHFPGVEIVPGLHAWGVASGPLTDETYAALGGRILAGLRAAGPVDAVLLSLHGSLDAESCPGCEGDLLGRIRAEVGPGVPVAASFDLHAVMSAAILRHADILAGYRTYPHVDMADTGRRTVAALAGWLAGGRRERAVVRRWPAIVPVDNAQTDRGPLAEAVAAVAALEHEPGIRAAALFCTHPWIDSAGSGVTLVAYATPAAAAAAGRRLEAVLARLWERRDEFRVDCPGPEEFYAGVAGRERPVAAIDAGDVTTAGAPGDSTVLLRAARAHGGVRVLIPLVDAATVAAAWAAGEGATAEFRVGGSDAADAPNTRVTLRAKVRRCVDGPIRVRGEAFGGLALDLGPRVLLEAGPVSLAVMQHASLFHDPELWRSLGVDPAAADVVVQKSHKLFRPAYAGIARSVATVDTPGATDRRLERLPYRRVPRPVFPLDPAAGFTFATTL
ncbi:MAG: M81 family metallopeptidase [Opitutaceae bacterium]|nr:M81 family metallopeptidase [Opitutaceae bacterium]